MRAMGVRLAITLGVLNLVLAFPASAQEKKPEFTVSVSAPVTTVADPMQLELSVTLTNTSDHAIAFSGDESAITSFLIDVFDATGKLAPETNAMRALKGEPPEPTKPGEGRLAFSNFRDLDLSLTPGESTVFRLSNICSLYRLTPGKYTLVATGYDFHPRSGKPPYGVGFRSEMLKRKQPANTDEGTSIPVRSNTISFEITTNSCPEFSVKLPAK